MSADHTQQLISDDALNANRCFHAYQDKGILFCKDKHGSGVIKHTEQSFHDLNNNKEYRNKCFETQNFGAAQKMQLKRRTPLNENIELKN